VAWGKHKYKRRYRQARVQQAEAEWRAKKALEEAKMWRKRYGKHEAVFAPMFERGEEIAGRVGGAMGGLSPSLRGLITGSAVAPQLGSYRLSGLADLPQQTRQYQEMEPVYVPNPFTVTPGAGVTTTKVGGAEAKRPLYQIGVKRDTLSQLLPSARLAQEFEEFHPEMVERGQRMELAQQQFNQQRKAYEKAMQQSKMWGDIQNRYKRKYAKSAASRLKACTVAIAVIATAVSMGALGAIFGTVGAGATAGTGAGVGGGAVGTGLGAGIASGTGLGAGATAGGLAGAFGAGGIGSTLAGAGLGAIGGGISGGWRGALLGGLGGALPGLAGMGTQTLASYLGPGAGLLGGAGGVPTALGQAWNITSPWLKASAGGLTDWLRFQQQLDAWENEMTFV